MACELEPQLSLLHDDQLAAPEAAALHAHIADCATCAEAARALDELAAALRADAAGIAPVTPAEHLAALRDVLGAAPLWRRRVAVPVPVLGGVVAVMVVLAAVVTLAGDTTADDRLVIEVVKRSAPERP
jgi:anti-sigma factor RsiW